MLASRRGAAIRPAAASRKACVAVRAYLPDQRGSKAVAWTPDSWRKLPVVQQPTYPDKEAVQRTLMDISAFPPLIFGEDFALLRGVTCGKGAQHVRDCSCRNILGTQGAEQRMMLSAARACTDRGPCEFSSTAATLELENRPSLCK